MHHLSDSELIHAYRQGKEEALSALVQRHLASVYRFLYRMLGDVHAAEDVAQDTFVKVWRNLSKFNTAKSFKVWLFSIAKNTAIDHLRKKNPLTFSQLENQDAPEFADTIVDVQPLAHELLEGEDTAKRLEEALAKLPPKAKSVVLMHESEDMTFQEIAEATREPMNTVKSRYRRALASLKNILKTKQD